MTPFGPWQFPDVADVNALHDDALQKYGGSAGFRDPNCPEAKIEATKYAVYYGASDEEEWDLLRAAAHLIVYFAKGHCYTDGNKRTAWLAALRLLDVNGIRLRGDDPEAVPLIESVVQDKATLEDLIMWLGKPERFFETPSQVQTVAVAEATATEAPATRLVTEA